MKLAISNIAWEASQDNEVYELMHRYGFTGLEIAPTRILPEMPYDYCIEAAAWAVALRKEHGFVIPSMQSIWYGRKEELFGSAEQRQFLLDYTKKAIKFASAVGCRNLVFGCPRNRCLHNADDAEKGIDFFRKLGDYAAKHSTVIGMEANPPLYNTNYINDTRSAFDLIETVNSEGFGLNLDLGTMIENKETVSVLDGRARFISHVHISEPGLGPIVPRALHNDIRSLLENAEYTGYVSIEMKKADDLSMLGSAMAYVSEVFR